MGRVFPTTRWSLVLAAGRRQTAESEEALADLCEAYWYPLYAYARRHAGGPEAALDLTQGYFALLLEKNYLGDYDPGAGRFRAFLLASFKNFLANERDRKRALKRGGETTTLSIDAQEAEGRYGLEPVDTVTPEQVYESRWAITVVERTFAEMRREAAQKNLGTQFEVLKRYLTGGSNLPPYRDVANELEMSEGAVKIAVHRLRKRFGEHLRKQVEATVVDPKEVDDELRHLLSVTDTSRA